MGMQRRVNHQIKHQWVDNPSSIRLIACILCHTAAGQKFTSSIKKIKDPITNDTVYFHKNGCPSTA